jgi:hypothetical protein
MTTDSSTDSFELVQKARARQPSVEPEVLQDAA